MLCISPFPFVFHKRVGQPETEGRHLFAQGKARTHQKEPVGNPSLHTESRALCSHCGVGSGLVFTDLFASISSLSSLLISSHLSIPLSLSLSLLLLLSSPFLAMRLSILLPFVLLFLYTVTVKAASVFSCSSCGYRCAGSDFLYECGGCDLVCGGCQCTKTTGFWVVVIGVPSAILILCCVCCGCCKSRIQHRIVVMRGGGSGGVVVNNVQSSPVSSPPPAASPTYIMMNAPLLKAEEPPHYNRLMGTTMP
jgi:hypothetical protein